MAHLTLLESTVGFVLLLAGIYAFLWGLWFLGVRFVPAWPFISLLRQTQRELRRIAAIPHHCSMSTLSTAAILKHPVDALPVAKLWSYVSTARASFPNRRAQSAGPTRAQKTSCEQGATTALELAQGVVLRTDKSIIRANHAA
jgi:hypothetical protein